MEFQTGISEILQSLKFIQNSTQNPNIRSKLHLFFISTNLYTVRASEKATECILD